MHDFQIKLSSTASPENIVSDFSRTFNFGSIKMDVLIHRQPRTPEWTLEVRRSDGETMKWIEVFPDDEAAFDAFLEVVEKAGFDAFMTFRPSSRSNVFPLGKKADAA